MRPIKEIFDEIVAIVEESKPKSEWISVKDRLPLEGDRVLVYGDDGIFRAYWTYTGYGIVWQCDPTGSFATDGCVSGVKKWQPLPNPPDQGEGHE